MKLTPDFRSRLYFKFTTKIVICPHRLYECSQCRNDLDALTKQKSFELEEFKRLHEQFQEQVQKRTSNVYLCQQRKLIIGNISSNETQQNGYKFMLSLRTFFFFFFFTFRDSICGPLERQARAQTTMLCRSPNPLRTLLF